MAIVIVISLHLYFSKIYDPFAAEFTAARETLAVLTQEVAGLGARPETEEIENRVSELKKEIEEANLLLEEILIKQKAQSPEKVTDALVGLNYLVLKNGLKVATIELKEEVKHNEPSEQVQAENGIPWETYHLRFSGDFNNIILLIDDIEEMDYLVQIANIEISYDDKANTYYVVMIVLI